MISITLTGIKVIFLSLWFFIEIDKFLGGHTKRDICYSGRIEFICAKDEQIKCEWYSSGNLVIGLEDQNTPIKTNCAPRDICSIEVLDFDIRNPEIVAKIWQGQGTKVDALLGCRKPTSIWNDTKPGMCLADNSYIEIW